MKEEPLVFTVDAENGFAGYVICHPYDPDSMEIGWVLCPEHWGKGYASELTEQLIEKARIAKKAVVIECDPGQSVSRFIEEKYGFTCLGEKMIRYCSGLIADYRVPFTAGSVESIPV